jgi:hypothetical protein
VTRPLDSNAVVSGELCVLFECHSVVCALPVRWVSRLLLADEARFVTSSGEAPYQQETRRLELGGSKVVEAYGQRCTAWDLGEMLELPPLRSAWVYITLPHRNRTVSLALRTGPCLLVGPVSKLTEVPGNIFRARRAGLPAAFPVRGTAAGGTNALVGLYLDPRGLWTEAELDRSASVAAASEAVNRSAVMAR